MGKNKFYSFCLVVLLAFGFCLKAHADLEWITGGVPKNTSEKNETTVVRDAPMGEGQLESTGNQDIILGLLTTCTKFSNQYPADSVNYFYINKNEQICYFAYFLMKPSSRIHTITAEWYSPSNTLVAKYIQEFRVSFVDRLLTIQNETYQWYLVQMTVGMDHMHPEYGQKSLPHDPGLYSIHLIVDGQLSGISFFYIKEQTSNAPAAVPTISTMKQEPAIAPATGLISPQKNRISPISTPLPILPIPKDIQ